MAEKTQTEKMFDMLMEGVPPEEVRATYPQRGATLTKAIQMYLDRASTQIIELQGKVEPLKFQVKNLEGDITLKTGQKVELEGHILEKGKTLQSLQRDTETSEGELTQRKAEVKQLQKLLDKGVPFDLVKRLNTFEVENGEELTQRIQTLEAYNQLVEETNGLEGNVDTLKTSQSQAKTELEKIRGDITSQRNELDAEKGKTRTYREVVETTADFLEDSYSIEQLKALRNGLKAVAVKNQPETSLTRLLQGLQNVKSLNQLDDRIEERGKTLDTLNSKINTAEGILTAYEQNILKKLDKTMTQGVKTFNTFYDAAKSDILALKQSTMAQLNEVNSSFINSYINPSLKKLEDTHNAAVNNLNQIGRAASGITTHLDSETGRVTTTLKNSILAITQQFIKDMGEYAKKLGELKAEAGKLEEELKLTRIITAIVKYPSEAKELPVDFAMLLQDAVYKFCLVKGLNPKVKAGDEINQKYYHIYSTYEMELKDLISWTMRGLEMGLR